MQSVRHSHDNASRQKNKHLSATGKEVIAYIGVPAPLSRAKAFLFTCCYMSRLQFLQSLGADLAVAEELAAYCDRKLDGESGQSTPKFPLEPEAHVYAWREYATEAERIGAFAELRKRLVQLNFPIQHGISSTDAYRAATRRGAPPDQLPEAIGLQLEQPEMLTLFIHESVGGPIPVICPRGRADFVSVLQALAKRNEPEPIPASMGAMMISGFNNWDRIRRLRDQWQVERRGEESGETWEHEFQTNVVPRHELYQDKFIILSDGPYSGIAADELGLSTEEWQRLSRLIRLEHECTHYFTRRYFGSAKNHLVDETIADYRGITAAVGRFRADWFLRFMGLEDYPVYRTGGRLENYQSEPPLSDSAFTILQALVKRAAENLQRFDEERADDPRTAEAQVRTLMILTRMTLIDLALNDRTRRVEKQ
jgi:hypothetical protein